MTDNESNQILLLAPTLLGETLALQLNTAESDLEVVLKKERLSRQPCLVIWSVESLLLPSAIQLELRRLQENWSPAPVLLLLPAELELKTKEFLQFDCPGLLQDPDLETLIESIQTLRGGGRVVRLKDNTKNDTLYNNSTMGLSQWLLLSGIQQINNELHKLDIYQGQITKNSFNQILILGRKRELNASKNLLFLLWGPLKISINPLETNRRIPNDLTDPNLGPIGYPMNQEYEINIDLKEREGMAVWQAIYERLSTTIQSGVTNETGNILAIEGLNTSRRYQLLIALLKQLDNVIRKLDQQKNNLIPYKETWVQIQKELRQEALREMTGSYVRIPFDGSLTPVGEHLLTLAELNDKDDELPDIEIMLDPLLVNKPLIVDGQLLPADDPRALMQLEMFFSNWIIRTAELISSEVIAVCGDWPELRRYVLNPELISTRELERLRNQLNSQNQWQRLIKRPIQLYESKRLFYRLSKGNIEPIQITEPRDDELRQLDWWQQQVALLVETRDAIAPQLQALIRKLGNLMVLVLTQIIGRAIGLVGRGIAQGMGRTMGRS